MIPDINVNERICYVYKRKQEHLDDHKYEINYSWTYSIISTRLFGIMKHVTLQSTIMQHIIHSRLRSEISPECFHVLFYPCLTFYEQQG